MANLSISTYLMSKGNMFFGKARGKLGDIVLFVRNGEQVQRPYNGNPKNPRSISQMKQRVKLASVVGFYKRQSAFFRFALKKKARESYYNAFVRYNLNIAPYLTKEQAALGYQIAAPYIIADGDMPRVDVSNVTVSIDNDLYVQTSINSGLTTWGAFRRAYNLLMGDMITFVIFNRSADSAAAAQRVVAQHVFDQESENMPFGYDVVGLSFVDNSGVWAFDVDKAYFGVGEWYATACAVVTSRNAGGVDCSFAQLVLSENAEAEYLVFHSDEQHEEAAASYGKVDSAILDPKSFEGNYVDVVQLYSDAAHQIPISAVELTQGQSKTFYADISRLTNLEEAETFMLDHVDLISSASASYTTGVITIKASDDGAGSGNLEIDWRSPYKGTVARSVLTVTVTAVP